MRVKLTTRLPGVVSRAAHFSSAKRLIIAAPNVPGEMMAPFAPVEAGLAHRAARMGEHVGRDLQVLLQESAPSAVSSMSCFFCRTSLCVLHAVEHLHAEIAGEMVIADACAAQRRILRTGAHAHVADPRGQALEQFQHAGDVFAGEAVVAVAALFLRLDQAAGLELSRGASLRFAA